MTTRLCFIDTETTGLTMGRHPLWEVAIIHRDEDGDEGEWLLRWRPDLSTAEPMALSLTGYWDRTPGPAPEVIVDGEQWDANSPKLPAALQGLQASWELTWSQPMLAALVAYVTAGCHLVGAVPDFDAYRLDLWLRQHGSAPAWHYHLVDVEPLMAGYLAGQAIYAPDHELGGPDRERLLELARPPWRSKDLAAAVGSPHTGVAHTAMDDARWARDCYDAVLGG